MLVGGEKRCRNEYRGRVDVGRMSAEGRCWSSVGGEGCWSSVSGEYRWSIGGVSVECRWRVECSSKPVSSDETPVQSSHLRALNGNYARAGGRQISGGEGHSSVWVKQQQQQTSQSCLPLSRHASVSPQRSHPSPVPSTAAVRLLFGFATPPSCSHLLHHHAHRPAILARPIPLPPPFN